MFLLPDDCLYIAGNMETRIVMDDESGGRVGNNCGLHQSIIPETEGLMCAVTGRDKGYQKTSQ
jgi:hypothetical protein